MVRRLSILQKSYQGGALGSLLTCSSAATAVKQGHFKRVIGAGFGEIDLETTRIKHLMRDRVIACAGMARRAGLLIGGVGKLLAGRQCAGLTIAPTPRSVRPDA